MLEHCGDIIRALVTGAAAEPELQAVLDEGHRRHVDGARTVVANSSGHEGPHLDTDIAATSETLAAITDFRFALVLARELRLVARPHRGMDESASHSLLLD